MITYSLIVSNPVHYCFQIINNRKPTVRTVAACRNTPDAYANVMEVKHLGT
ncbi:MAG: hypothetical protein ACJAXK_001535 [Yoonia sp.]|jgi:hypothetical protein